MAKSMTAKEFLIKEGLLTGDCTQFYITFDDGRSFELVDLLEKFKNETQYVVISDIRPTTDPPIAKSIILE